MRGQLASVQTPGRSLTSSPWPSKVAESLKSGIHKTLEEKRGKKKEAEEVES
jgi:hypothetical protein